MGELRSGILCERERISERVRTELVLKRLPQLRRMPEEKHLAHVLERKREIERHIDALIRYGLYRHERAALISL